jgi:hypothetical protein
VKEEFSAHFRAEGFREFPLPFILLPFPSFRSIAQPTEERWQDMPNNRSLFVTFRVFIICRRSSAVLPTYVSSIADLRQQYCRRSSADDREAFLPFFAHLQKGQWGGFVGKCK